MLSNVIVKVQIPIATSDTDKNMCLIYDKERKHMVKQELSSKAREMMRGDMRAFFEATFSEVERVWNLHKRAPEQFW